MPALIFSLWFALAAGPKAAAHPGYCEIEIINSSHRNATVYGTFDDSLPLNPFAIRGYDEGAHYISLYYSGYCHYDGMRLIVELHYLPYDHIVYDAWTRPGSIVRIIP
jgi:hypothetical protein